MNPSSLHAKDDLRIFIHIFGKLCERFFHFKKQIIYRFAITLTREKDLKPQDASSEKNQRTNYTTQYELTACVFVWALIF